MGVYFNPRNILYRQAKNSQIFVDKSEMIDVINSFAETDRKNICVSRPRRFGKSMTAHMLSAYYSRGCDSRELFSGLKISETENFEKYLNKYNVIQLNMVQYLTEAKDIDEMIKFIEEDVIDEIYNEFPDLKKPRRETLVNVIENTFQQFVIPFVFIIDEWDCVMRRMKNSEADHIKYLDFLRNLLKDRSYVALAYMTGILPIKKYGEHSALNMFNEYSMENQHEFSEYTGFTERETEELCIEYGMDTAEIKKWYNGYILDGEAVYNPRSVVCALIHHSLENYWTKTETYEALKKYILLDMDGLKEKVKKMIAGESVAVNTLKFRNDMTNLHSADDVLTLLIHLGYLTYDIKTGRCHIPNNEVATEFINCIDDEKSWEQVMNAVNQSEKCLKAVLSGDEETVARIVEQTHQDNVSIIEYNDENSLSCIVSLAFYTARNQYEIFRELPSGKGYADLAFIPRPKENVPAIVVELKKKNSPSIAIEQIKNRQYFDKIKAFSGEMLLVGINYTDENNGEYKRHECRIEKIVK